MMYERMVLYTNRNIMVFGHDGNQDPLAQGTVSCYDIDKMGAMLVINQTEKFFVSRHAQWIHPISRHEMEYLLGLRTREMDREVQASP